MFKNIFILCVGLFLSTISDAQQDQYKWSVGIHGGIMNYYGDLNHSILDPNRELTNPWENREFISYGLSVENHMTPAWSLRFMGTRGYFITNQRRMNWKGNVVSDGADFTKALNARTEIWDASIMLTYHLDNGKLLPKRGFIAPYLTAGVGFAKFDVYGDLFFNDIYRYYYWSDYTIRDIPEDDINAGQASIILEQDGDFETQLNGLQTEGVDYRSWTIQYPVGLGLKFRLSKQFNLNLESILHFTHTDYLDDVSGNVQPDYDTQLQAYAANPGLNPDPMRGRDTRIRNDMYAFTSISLHYNFARRRDNKFMPPFILSSAYEEVVSPIDTLVEETEPMEEKPWNYDEDGVDYNETDMDDDDMVLEEVYEDHVIFDTSMTSIRIDSIVFRVDSITNGIRDTISIDTFYSVKVDSQMLVNEEIMDIQVADSSMNVIGIDTVSLDTEDIAYMMNDTIGTVNDTSVTVVKPIDTSISDGVSEKPMEDDLISEDPGKQKEALTDVSELDALRAELRQMKEDQLNNQVKQLEQKVNELNQILLKTQMEQEQERLRNEVRQQFNDYRRELDQLKYQLELLKLQRTGDQSSDKGTDASDKLAIDAEMRELRRKLDLMEREYDVISPTVVMPSQSSGISKQDAEILKQLALIEERLDQQKSENGNNTEVMALLKSLEARMETQGQYPSIPSYQSGEAELIRQFGELKSQLQQNQIVENEYNRKVLELTEKMNALPKSNDTQLLAEIKRLETLIGMRNSQRDTVYIRDSKTMYTEPKTSIVTDNARDAIKGLEVSNIFFDTGSSIIRSEYQTRLDRLSVLLLGYPDLSVQLTGYTDSSGNPSSNLVLSRKRAESVKNYLLGKGVPSSRISTFPNGEDNSPDKKYARRVEVLMVILR